MTLKEFVDHSGIRILEIERNENIFDSERGYHYRIVLCRGKGRNKRRMTVYFCTGIGWERMPDVYDVMDSLRADAIYARDCSGFDQFCRDFCVAPSAEAERAYRVLFRETGRLRKFLGELYDDFLDSRG